MFKHSRAVAVTAMFALLLPIAAHAAAVRSGTTNAALPGPVIGNGIAFDSVHNVYLTVGGYGIIYGRFVQEDGTPIGSPFAIQGVSAPSVCASSSSTCFGQYPRVAFSPDADNGSGAFLVTWHEGIPTMPHARMVSFPRGGPYGNETLLAAEPSWWQSGAAMAYSTVSHEFLVAWRRPAAVGGIPDNIHAVFVDNNGSPIGSTIAITNDIDFKDNASMAYNPSTDEFLVAFSGYNNAGVFAYVDYQRVQAGTGQLLGARGRLTTAVGTYITDVTYNPTSNTYLASWFAMPAAVPLARVLAADGTQTGNIITLSTRWASYDGLNIAFNSKSNTFFMVAEGQTTTEDGGVELTSAGSPVDNGFQITSTTARKGNFFPRIAASADLPNWLVSDSLDFTTGMVQLVAGTTASGGGTPTPPPAPSPTSRPLVYIDTPGNSATVSSTGFVVAGWALDLGGTSSTDIDAVAIWAFPSNGATAILGGIPTYGFARPDVGAAYGSQFTNSGYGMTVTLPPGSYTLSVYAHSTLSNSWSSPTAIQLTVQGPVSRPSMWVDLPAQNSTNSQNLLIEGWAVDMGAPSGTGVDAVHVWAYPSTGAAPVLVGTADPTNGGYGISRPDVGAALGSANFTPSGFKVTGTLPPGTYTLAVFAHSTVANAFNNVFSVAIQVR